MNKMGNMLKNENNQINLLNNLLMSQNVKTPMNNAFEVKKEADMSPNVFQKMCFGLLENKMKNVYPFKNS